MSEPPIVADGQPVAGSASPPYVAPSGAAGTVAAQMSERPELAIGGAFAGGFVLALILKRLAR